MMSQSPLTASIRRSEPRFRIDSAILPVSWIQRLIYSVLAVVVIGLSYLAKLLVWHYGILIIGLLLTAIAIWLTRDPIVQITQPPLRSSISEDWLLMRSTTRGKALWRADLIDVQDCGVVVVLKFAVTHPYNRGLSCAIFQDQVPPLTWHQIKVLAQLI